MSTAGPGSFADRIQPTTDRAVQAGQEAIALPATIRPVRTLDRLEPLQTAATEPSDGSNLADLAASIATLRAA